MAFANITPTALTDGIVYSNAVPLTPTEADLNGGTGVVTTPIPTETGQAVQAVIRLSATGIITGNSAWVFLQQDLGDDVWVDLNWVLWDGRQGSAVFVMSNGIAGANSFQQSRQASSTPNPQANGSNQLCLGGRLRFTGFAKFIGGSSSLAGVPSAVTAIIRYKLLHMR